MSYTVGQIARLAGVTIRTLHHYDEIGLLSPQVRSNGGYRRYGQFEVERLQQIMFYRELGFALDEITALVHDPYANPQDHLRRQRDLLVERRRRVQQMIDAVEKAMEAEQMGIAMSPEERFEVFGEDDPATYAAEVEQRWGDTDAYRESQRRTRVYSKDDWLAIKQESADIEQAFARAMAAGLPADSEDAMDAAQRHRVQISDRFFACDYDFHRALADMYVADERFAAHYDAIADGLAAYVNAAIHANATRHET